VVNILETAMASTLAPRISSLYWSDRRDEVEQVTLKAVYWLFIPSFLLTVVLAVFAHPILSLFGKEFTSGATVLALIAIGQLVSVSSGAVGWLMNMTGQQSATAVVDVVVAAITMVGYLTLIPWLGINGAAIANGGAVVMRNVSLNILARRRLGYRISVLRAFRAH
jgi:O-antigen/teichoic acid export membrane protein